MATLAKRRPDSSRAWVKVTLTWPLTAGVTVADHPLPPFSLHSSLGKHEAGTMTVLGGGVGLVRRQPRLALRWGRATALAFTSPSASALAEGALSERARRCLRGAVVEAAPRLRFVPAPAVAALGGDG